MSRSFGGQVRHVAAADPKRARGNGLQAGNHLQRRRLAAAGWPDQHGEFAVGDLEIEVWYDDMGAVTLLTMLVSDTSAMDERLSAFGGMRD